MQQKQDNSLDLTSLSSDRLEAILRDLNQLRQNKAWETLNHALADQVRVRNSLIMSPLETRDAVFKQEFLKGEVSGIQLALRFVDYLEDVIRDEMHRRKVENEKEANDE